MTSEFIGTSRSATIFAMCNKINLFGIKSGGSNENDLRFIREWRRFLELWELIIGIQNEMVLIKIVKAIKHVKISEQNLSKLKLRKVAK